MKKLILILTIFAFTGQELIAQWSMGGSSTIYRSGGADRASDGGGVFDTQGDWSLDATISQYTSAQALDGSQNGTSTNWAGNSHNGHGANGWGSAALGAYNRASGVGSFVAGFNIKIHLFCFPCVRIEKSILLNTSSSKSSSASSTTNVVTPFKDLRAAV